MIQLDCPPCSLPPRPDPKAPHHWLDRISEQARLHPRRTALISGSHTLSFAGLEARSNQLARELAAAGIGAGDYVGAGLRRSNELIVALLGILKSGAAYIPLDPGYPQARLSRMIATARLKVVVTVPELAPSFPGVTTLIMNSDEPAGSADHAVSRKPGHPVYAIFTSGSTGQPKAASVFHSGFENLLDWYGAELALGPADRTLVIGSPSFDQTQKNFFTPLLTGGTLILDDSQTYDIPRILALIRDHGVTLMNCTPTAFYPLVDAAAADGFSALSTLRHAVLGGEAISIPRLRPWLEHPACQAQVVNTYGPTECTDTCTYYRMNRGNIDSFPFVPIGRELPHTQITIRDAGLALLPDGEMGELCIGGICLGGGYLNDPQRTAECFVDGIYRSGDLAIRLPCGSIEFRGRADHQVKVNGFRIELGEIEIALNEHEDVSDAVVTASDGKLTAHILGSAAARELQLYLAAKLPSYMIPADFRHVAAFPLTPNGKVNRKLLSDIRPATLAAPAAVTSGSSLESTVLALWSEVIGHTVTDATANFFDLGGNSVHLAVVHVRLREMTGRDFPLTDLFAYSSARAIATHLSPAIAAPPANPAQQRAQLAKAGFARFQRPLTR